MTSASLTAQTEEIPGSSSDKERWVKSYLGVDLMARREMIRGANPDRRARSQSFTLGGERGAKPGEPLDGSAKAAFDQAYAKALPMLAIALEATVASPAIGKMKTKFQADHAVMQAAAARVDYAAASIELQKLLPQAEALKQTQIAANKRAAASDKLDAQKAQQATMEDTLGAVERSYFAKGGADNLSKAKLKAGNTFKAVISALKTVESDKSDTALDALEKAATTYLAHFESDYSAREKKTKESQRKKEVCETALTQVKHWRILADFRAAGDPPWDAVTDNKVQGANARLVFEQNLLTIPDKTSLLAKPEGQQGVSESFWIKDTAFGTPDSKDPSKDKRNRQLFFKPMDGEEKMTGLPQGGSAVREAAGKAVGDTLKAMTGFDVGMPNCCLTSISNDMLAGKDGVSDPEKPKNRLGSMQQFVASDGSLSEAERRDPTLKARIPAAQTQKLALLDLLSLNQDRHSGNAMVGNAAGVNGAPPSLTPIDQGLVLPNRAGFDSRRQKMLPTHNMLAELPGADEKLSPEIQKALAMLQPKDIGDGVRDSLGALDASHPDANASAMVDDEAITMAERSTAFVKFAASELTVKQLYNALAVDSEAIFDCSDTDMDKSFKGVVERAKLRGTALGEFAQMTNPQKITMDRELKELGWGVDRPNAGFSMMKFEIAMEYEGPDLLKRWKNKTENAALRRDMLEKLNELGNPPDLTEEIKGLPIGTAWAKVDEKLEKGNLKRRRKDDAKLLKDEPKLQREYEQLGGDAAFEKLAAITYVDADDVIEKIRALRAWLEYQKLGGDAAYFAGGGDGDIQVEQRIGIMKFRLLEKEGDLLAG